MSVVIKGKRRRNVPEQVLKNKDDIKELKELIGSQVKDVKVFGESVVDEDQVANIDNVVGLENNQTITGRKVFVADQTVWPTNQSGIKIIKKDGQSDEYLTYTYDGVIGTLYGNSYKLIFPKGNHTLATETDVQQLGVQLGYRIDAKQDKLTAGSGISIVNNVISVTLPSNVVTTDTAQEITGEKTFKKNPKLLATIQQPNVGITASDGVHDGFYKFDPEGGGTVATTDDISDYHDSTKQDKLTAGLNITIQNNVISATGTTPSNMMTTDTNQVVSGSKTFANGKEIRFNPNVSTDGTTYVNNKELFLSNASNVVTELFADKIKRQTSGGSFEIAYPSKNGTLATEYTAGTGISIVDNVISATGSASVSWDDIQDKPTNFIFETNLDTKVSALTYTKKDYVDEQVGDVAEDLQTEKNRAINIEAALASSKQDKLTAGQNITIQNNVISATGEPTAYLKEASVSGNTLSITKKDGSVVSFTPASEGGITDVKVNGSSVVTEGVANISIPEDAQLVYDLTLNPSTGQVTINNPNYYQRIVDYIEENDKYPIIYGVVHIATKPDLVIICKDITISDTGILINGYVTSFGGNYNTYDVIEINTTSTTQAATYDQTKGVNDTAPRITKVEATDNSLFFEDATGHDVEYNPTYNNLSDKPDLSQYQTVSGLNAAVSALGYLKEVSWEDIEDKPTFATVATSGSYNDLTNKPTIPTKTSDLTNDSGFITASVSNLTNYYDKTAIDEMIGDVEELLSEI